MIDADFGDKQRDRIPDSVIAQVKAVPGVADAQGDVTGFAGIIGKDGKPLGQPGNGPPTFGSRRAHAASLAHVDLRRGQAGRCGGDQVAIDNGTAKQGPLQGRRQGHDRRRPPAPGSSPSSGIASFGDADSPGGATFALFDLPDRRRSSWASPA